MEHLQWLMEQRALLVCLCRERFPVTRTVDAVPLTIRIQRISIGAEDSACPAARADGVGLFFDDPIRYRSENPPGEGSR